MVFYKLQDPSVNEKEKVKAVHFDEKIKLVRHLFDEDVQDTLSNSYGLLSKGIHELNDEQIKEFYSYISEIINIQLESEKEKILRQKKIEEIKNKINNEALKNK